ncbi:MAG: ABC transporter permease [Hyphomicrobiaceae bacterium]
MNDTTSVFFLAFQLVVSLDATLYAIIALSLVVSLSAVFFGALFGIPFGAALSTLKFPGRGTLIALVNAFMGLPPVVVGLLVYMMLSRSGPFGVLGLLYTPTAMIIAQSILVMPLIAALSRQLLSDLNAEYDELFRSLRLTKRKRIMALIWDGRYGLLTATLAGFGRAIAEVGAVMIVGGNIEHVTRVMTTTIALETSKGNLALALALGLVLITISILVNVALLSLNRTARRSAYA